MRDDEALPISTPTSSSIVSSSYSGIPKPDHPPSSACVFGRGGYKFWALAAILLLALWSMVTGTVTLRWSAGNLNHVADDYHFPSTDDLDVLDLEEREKMVKRMWDEYTNSHRIRVAGFWQEAFVAAYEDLTSEVSEVRQAAISEIARMSALYIKLDPLQDLCILRLICLIVGEEQGTGAFVTVRKPVVFINYFLMSLMLPQRTMGLSMSRGLLVVKKTL